MKRHRVPPHLPRLAHANRPRKGAAQLKRALHAGGIAPDSTPNRPRKGAAQLKPIGQFR